MKEKYYITMAIAYTSRVPHIGNTYEAVLTDAISRYKKLRGYDVYFLTGTDEHGQKIQEEALKNGKTPKEYVDGICSELKNIWKMMNIDYTNFIRTTDEKHKLVVQKIFKQLYEQGDIYKGDYEGYYCVPCESFYTESQLVDGKCPDCGREVKLTKEESYFFRLSKYEDRLKKHIEENPDFIYPASRKNEMLNNFINKGLKDLCVSRTSFDWGIPIEIEEGHIAYVWIDALSNYISAIGYKSDDERLFNKLWPADVHVVGKDIVRFHTVYWPIFLMALGLPLPKQIYGHPWLLSVSDSGQTEKMSKSKGNVLYANDLVKDYSTDRVRYSVLREMPFADDGYFSRNILIQRTNVELVNIIGNLLHRTTSMSKKYFDNLIKKPEKFEDVDRELIDFLFESKNRYENYMDSFYVSKAMNEVVEIAKATNKYIDITMPWKLAKEDTKRLNTVMYVLLENLKYVGIMLNPFVPETSQKLLNQIGINNLDYSELDNYGSIDEYKTTVGEVLFERLDLIEDNEPKEERVEYKPEISIDDFSKMDIRIVKILEVEDHPKADKLYVLKLDVQGDIREVVSGIKNYYSKEELIGKKVAYLANLKPIKLRGVESSGMVLAQSKDDRVVLLEGSIEGAIVG